MVISYGAREWNTTIQTARQTGYAILADLIHMLSFTWLLLWVCLGFSPLWHLLFTVQISLGANLGSSFSKSTFGVSPGDQYSVLGNLLISVEVCGVSWAFSLGQWPLKAPMNVVRMLQRWILSIFLISGSFLPSQYPFLVAMLNFWHHSYVFCFLTCFHFCLCKLFLF